MTRGRRCLLTDLQVPDIRLFWTTDERFTSQFKGASATGRRDIKFVPFSKYPM